MEHHKDEELETVCGTILRARNHKGEGARHCSAAARNPSEANCTMPAIAKEMRAQANVCQQEGVGCQLRSPTRLNSQMGVRRRGAFVAS